MMRLDQDVTIQRDIRQVVIDRRPRQINVFARIRETDDHATTVTGLPDFIQPVVVACLIGGTVQDVLIKQRDEISIANARPIECRELRRLGKSLSSILDRVAIDQIINPIGKPSLSGLRPNKAL